jgi:WD40 repeat protein
VICTDEDYVKIWNITKGKLQSTLDYSRKKVANCLILNEGKVLVVKLKKDNRVILVDLETNFEKTLSEGDDEPKM